MHLQISTQNAEFQIIQSLKLNRTKRSKAGELFVEGIESIKQALSAQWECTRLIAADLNELLDWAKALLKQYPRTTIIEMTRDLYASLCEREEPSELLATFKIRTIGLENVVLSPKPLVLIFDRPSDYGNFGSIVRSANSFGIEAILVIGHAVDVYDPKVIRASLGSIFHTQIVAVPSMEALATWLEQQRQLNGLQLVGSDSTGAHSLDQVALTRPLALVLGNEAKGMSVALQGLCTSIVRIPLVGDVNSLNVACAGSILLWEAHRHSLIH